MKALRLTEYKQLEIAAVPEPEIGPCDVLVQVRACGICGEYCTCLELMTRQTIRVELLITATAPLDEGPTWFDRLYRGGPCAMNVILQPT